MLRTIKPLLSLLVLLTILFLPFNSFSQWKVIDEIDAFGDPTGGKMVGIKVEGTFSNSATAGSCVNASLVFYKMEGWSRTFIKLLLQEYCDDGNAVVSFTGGGVLAVKIENYKVFNYKINQSMNIYSELGYSTIKNFIKQIRSGHGKKLKFVAFDNYGSQYNFEIEQDNFIKIYDSVFN